MVWGTVRMTGVYLNPPTSPTVSTGTSWVDNNSSTLNTYAISSTPVSGSTTVVLSQRLEGRYRGGLCAQLSRLPLEENEPSPPTINSSFIRCPFTTCPPTDPTRLCVPGGAVVADRTPTAYVAGSLRCKGSLKMLQMVLRSATVYRSRFGRCRQLAPTPRLKGL